MKSKETFCVGASIGLQALVNRGTLVYMLYTSTARGIELVLMLLYCFG
jgi:hypothetical protein